MKRSPLKRGSGLQRKVGMTRTALSRNKRVSDRLAEKRNLTRRGTLKSRPDPIDAKFSLMIREQANWICARCKGDFSERKYLLHCSHFFSRNRYAVRFDVANVIALLGGPEISILLNSLSKVAGLRVTMLEIKRAAMVLITPPAALTQTTYREAVHVYF